MAFAATAEEQDFFLPSPYLPPSPKQTQIQQLMEIKSGCRLAARQDNYAPLAPSTKLKATQKVKLQLENEKNNNKNFT